MDILIYAKPEKVEHKMIDKVSDDVIYCYWRVGIHPNLKSQVINKVYFSDMSRIFAQGDYIGNDYEPDEYGDHNDTIGLVEQRIYKEFITYAR